MERGGSRAMRLSPGPLSPSAGPVVRAPQPRSDHRRSDQVKHQRGSSRRMPGRIVTIVVAIIGAAAIAAGISLFNKSSDPSGPLPVHLPTTPQAYLAVYAARAPLSYRG